MSWETDTASDMIRIGEYIPGEMLDDVGKGTRGISEALKDLIGAHPDSQGRGALCRIVAAKLVKEYLESTGKEAAQMFRLIMDYTDGLPTAMVDVPDEGISRERVITITTRAADYVVVE